MTKPYRGEEKEGLLKEAKMLDIAYPWSLFGEQKLWLKVAKIYKFSSSFINETILADGSEYLSIFFLFSTRYFFIILKVHTFIELIWFYKKEKLLRKEILNNFYSFLYLFLCDVSAFVI